MSLFVWLCWCFVSLAFASANMPNGSRNDRQRKTTVRHGGALYPGTKRSHLFEAGKRRRCIVNVSFPGTLPFAAARSFLFHRWRRNDPDNTSQPIICSHERVVKSERMGVSVLLCVCWFARQIVGWVGMPFFSNRSCSLCQL